MAQSFLIAGNKIPNKSHAYFCSPPILRARRLTPRFNELGPDGKRMNKSFWQKGAGGGWGLIVSRPDSHVNFSSPSRTPWW